ncbi:hypothetical protein OHS33_00855 [Streptomyces sp. NBC_00536]|uniref:hypothetical protein n=1 Tax=Streptomyces sp. NBC_00536 TaxID=2975769 RepID=UPI002E81F1BC|nr:hypothetical protein [Streptomyces sp. NBC_00536]WUC77022.1 hypothetical protein OHS33_00855 [Streptomyces sp. NBC_00536]
MRTPRTSSRTGRARAIAVAVGATAALAAAVVAAPTASAAAPARTTGTLSCGWINIGLPGSYWSYNNEYAGQVEQEYNTCNGNVMAHWQWASGYQSNHPNASVYITAQGADGHYVNGSGGTPSKDVFTWARNIHDSNPDEWYATAYVSDGCGRYAYGTDHNYADGGSLWGPYDVHC